MAIVSRPRIQDIAKLAGVSTATVDRVLNNRGGASKKAADLVMNAARVLSDSENQDPTSDTVYDVILPDRAGQSTEYLTAAFRYHAARRGIRLRLSFVERLNPLELSAALYRCGREGSGGIAFQALEDPVVREAASHLIGLGIPLLTVVSGLAGMGFPYIGLDNRAAGRTAGYMMGLLCRGAGPVAVVWGGHLYRGHEEREFGFRSILRTDFPDMEIFDITSRLDDAKEGHEHVRKLVASKPSLAGIYCVGAGIAGAVEAVGRGDRRRRIVIGHNLTTQTREFLSQRRVDVIIHQDMNAIAAKAIDYLAARPPQRGLGGEVPVQIITRENLSNQLDLEALREFLAGVPAT